VLVHPPAPAPAPTPHDGSRRRSLRALELGVLTAVQRRAGHPGLVRAARALGRFGDHAAGWLALGAVGWALDRDRRGQWAGAASAVLGAHAATVVVKRVLRRARPDGAGITVHARTPGRLSFPSSHAASTTAAAVAYGRLLGVPRAPVLLAPVMGASRLLLGLHFPTDVAAGTAVGVLAGRLARPGRRPVAPAGARR
jgi:membrane-associated phospholipid phosphatase